MYPKQEAIVRGVQQVQIPALPTVSSGGLVPQLENWCAAMEDLL